MQIDVKHVNNAVIALVLGERIDAKVSDVFRRKIFSLIENGNHNIILNISNVKFVDSSGLGAMVACLKQVKEKGQIVICSINSSVEKVFKLSRVNKVFRLFLTEEDAVAFFQSPQ